MQKRRDVEVFLDSVRELVEGLVERPRHRLAEEGGDDFRLLEQPVQVDAQHCSVDEPKPVGKGFGYGRGRPSPAVANLVAAESLPTEMRPRLREWAEPGRGQLSSL